MRVAYVTTDPGILPDGVKGASVHVRAILSALLRQGAEVTLFAPSRTATPSLDEFEEVRWVPLPRPKHACAEARAEAQIAANAALDEILANAGPFDLIYERHALFSDAAMVTGAAQGIPTILEVNAPLIEEQATHRILPERATAEAMAHASMRAARRVVAVSPGVAAYAEALGASDIRVIPNGVDAARFPYPPRFLSPFTMGFVGTLKPWHDVACLVDALGHLRRDVADARLLIVGDGPERSRLAEQADRLGLSNAVEFTGGVEARDVPALLERMHVGLAPYRGGDPFYFSPLKIYEYMAAALPVIASDLGGLREIVEPPNAGQVVPPDDPEALAAALSTLARDPSIGRRQGRRGRAHVIASASWDHVLAASLDGFGTAYQIAS